MRTLAVLRDAECIPTLIPALSERSTLGEAAWRVLRMLTGQDFGTDEDAWRAWHEENGSRPRIEWLIESLDHDDPECRKIGSRDLIRMSGEDFGLDVDLPPAERRAVVEQYRKWWSQRRAASA
mgnify:FL=1